MNYYYEPEVAAEVAAWVNFITPVKGAYEAALEIDEEVGQQHPHLPGCGNAGSG
jgi:spermidine/putrescine transport system substrate-binding protein